MRGWMNRKKGVGIVLVVIGMVVLFGLNAQAAEGKKLKAGFIWWTGGSCM